MQMLKADEIINLSESVLKKLTLNRIKTIDEFLHEDIGKLAAYTKLNLSQILDVRNEILAKYSAPVINGSILLERSKFLSSGIERLDSLLGGGIPKDNIIELCGLAGSGKTQLCFQLAINCVKTSNNTVLYIDTKGDFSAVRIQKILDTAGISHIEMATIMSKIKVVRIWTIEELIELFQNIKQKKNVVESLVLIIVDSLPSLMLQFLGDDNKLGFKYLNTLVNYSRYLTKQLQIALICVNIQTRWIDQDVIDTEEDGELALGKETYTEKRNRCLGRYWQHLPHLVLLIEKSNESNTTESGSQIVASLIHSSVTTNTNECRLSLNNLGVT